VTALLSVRGVEAGYEGTVVIRGVDLEVAEGTTAVVIGPNGHGKTTLLRVISGLLGPIRGEISLDGERIDGRPAETVAARGVVHVMQGDGLFPEMTVEENLMMGAFPGRSWRGRRTELARIYERFPVVHGRRDQKARTLSGGERRLVGLGRGLMRPARLLLIDEPSLGLAPVAIDAVYEAIAEIRATERTIVLVEENFSHIAGVADVVHVLETGAIVRSGSYGELSKDPAIVETYLGGATGDGA
jgi:branched-chain amino acid transport system ATP-binding protein